MTWLTWRVYVQKVKLWVSEIMSDHSISRSRQSFVVWHNTLWPFTYTPACVKLRQQWGFWNSLLTLAECFTLWQKADACCQPNSSLRNRSLVSDKMLKLVGKSHSLVSDKCFAIFELWFVIFSNLFTPVHLYYRPQIKRIHVFKRIFRSDKAVKIKMQLTWRGLEKFCQVMFCYRHFHCVRIEPTRKRRCIEFLTTQTDQSKCDILIDYVLRKLTIDYYMHPQVQVLLL